MNKILGSRIKALRSAKNFTQEQVAKQIGVSRQTAVLAFQFGDGLSNIFWPTADIVIICGLGGISLQKWYKWFTPLFCLLFVAQAVLVGVAAGIGY